MARNDQWAAPLPVSQLTIDGVDFDDPIAWKVRSPSNQPIDWRDLEIDNLNGLGPTISRGSVVELHAGYAPETVLPVVFSGVVDDVQVGRTITLQCADHAVKLRDRTFVRSWRNVTPREIAADVFRDVGVESYRVGSAELPRRPHFVARGINGLQLLTEVARCWGISDWLLYAEPDGSFWWGPWIESPRQLADRTIRYWEGRDTFDVIRPAFGPSGRLVVQCEPWIRHSDVIAICDAESGNDPVLARAVTVEHVLGEHPEYPHYRTEVEWV